MQITYFYVFILYHFFEVKRMKKIIALMMTLLVLCACATQNKEENAEEIIELDDISIVCPSGAPSLAFYDEIKNDNFLTGDAKSILPELTGEKGSDIIVIDTVSGIKALNSEAKYKLAATITFGNFYLAATGHDEDGIMNEGDYIVLFSQGATPDLVFHAIYGEAYDADIHYVNAVADATPCLVKGINIYDDEHSSDEEPYVDYVMIAEPALTAAMAQNDKISIYADIQKEYNDKTGLSLIQASVFVSDSLAKDKADAYLDKLKTNIRNLLNNPDLFGDNVDEAGLSDEEVKDLFGIPNVKIAKTVLTENSIGLGYENAYDNKQTIDGFISLFGLKETSEENYYK